MMDYEKYMCRCLQLASLAFGNTYPNPLVGCVIVHKGRIIGEGYHKKAGGPHAEVNAIASVFDKSVLPDSTLYVNLEPCSHHGRTPPCADLIIQHRIPHVVIASADTNIHVNGSGISRLKNNGVKVELGILDTESRELNRRFFTFHEKKRPYVILKWAQTPDGFIDKLREPIHTPTINWITGTTARRLVHRWRSEETSIMIGRRTALSTIQN